MKSGRRRRGGNGPVVASGRVMSNVDNGRRFLKVPDFMKTSLATLLVFGLSAAAAPAAVIISDNFNAPDINNFDNSDQTGRRDGVLAETVQLRSSRFQHSISDNQLLMGIPGTGSGRIRFHDVADNFANWHNFAAGAAAAAILGDGGFIVEFDWYPVNNTNDNWVSWNVGINGQGAGEPGVRVNDAGTDFGILFRHNGGTQYFDNGAPTTGPNFDPTLDVRHVRLEYRFNSFEDGTTVSVSASVNGQSILSGHTFQWDGNNGVLHMELGAYEAGTRIDNFVLSTIPEPSAAGLCALAGGLATLRRRRR